jgi:FkbM family methyltransferase
MRSLSFRLLPGSGQQRLRVKSGPAEGLIFDLNPRWEHSAWEGSYEHPVQQEFVRFATPGAIVYDIGANFGFYSLLGARIGARLIAFEPDKSNAATLARHATLNHLQDRIQLVPSAVFSYTGEISLELPGEPGTHGNARAVLVPTNRATVCVSCTTLDDFTALNPAPDLVKMDVEGGESDVLRGANRTFRMLRPVLLCEIHDGENASFAHEWLRERGYDCSWIEDEESFPRHLLAYPHEKTTSSSSRVR